MLLSLQVGSPESADLQVDFLHGYHGDSYPFDGAGGAVGHAFFPSDPARAGGVHLDSEEQWAFRQPGGQNTVCPTSCWFLGNIFKIKSTFLFNWNWDKLEQKV